MSKTDRMKRENCPRVVLLVDSLEGRTLLNATSLTKHIVTKAHVEVSKPTALEKKVEPIEVKTSKLAHDEIAKSSSAKPVVKTSSKGLPAVPPRKLTNLILSRLVTPATEASGSPVAGAYSPAQLETAYGVSSLGIANEGQGQTIGIVDVFADPNIITDANAYSTEYGLPQFNVSGGPTLTAYKDTATGTVANSATSGGNDTSSESSLDVEVAHAMAPKANILFVEVSSGSGTLNAEFISLLKGIQYAATQGASVVSLSYGYTESGIGTGNVSSDNSTYLATTPVTNIAVTVSTGDSGYPGFPGTSPNVIGVGGTSLHLISAGGRYGYELAWGGQSGAGAGGGGVSAVFATPSFQSSNGVNFGHRSLPDVSLVADPYTGVSVYDSWDQAANGGSPWTAYGGTSVASPIFAGILGIAQQESVAAGKGILTSAQIDNALYAAYNSTSYSTYFHDVTLGNNHDIGTTTTYYSAVTGYDEATGIGSPIASTLVPYLATI